MAKYATLESRITRSLIKNPRQSHMVWGGPGNGKTSLAWAIANGMEIPKEAQFLYRPSTGAAEDWTGLMDMTQEITLFKLPEIIHKINSACSDNGLAFLCIDEITHSDGRMFNALGGLLLDREIGGHRVDERCIIVCTGNRTTDKAGSNQMPSQVRRRVMHHDMESDIHGWAQWALTHDIQTWLVAFLRFKPDMLNHFDPNARSYPCEASWEMVSNSIPEDADQGELVEMMTGLVGEAAAVAAAGFKRISDSLPDMDVIMMRPKEADVPTDPATLYAVSGALAHRITPDNFDRTYEYIRRLPKDFSIRTVQDVLLTSKDSRGIKKTKAFQTFSVENANVLCG